MVVSFDDKVIQAVNFTPVARVCADDDQRWQRMRPRQSGLPRGLRDGVMAV
ncbi:MAG: hypothetical protein ACREPL_11150 [Rhodanobacteraceae bacterium]